MNMNEKIRIIYDMEIPMRDGVILRSNVFGPDDNKPYPAVLIHFPYLKDKFETHWGWLNPLPIARAGYRVVIQDCRGTGKSDGEMDFDFACQSQDGYDTVEWLASQAWCDGNVGMYGLSYYGFTQMMTAQAQPPHLKSIAPWMQTGLFKYSGGFTTGSLHLSWLLERARDRYAGDNSGLPRAEADALLERISAYLNDFGKLIAYVPEDQNPAAFIPGIPMLEDYARRIRECDSPTGCVKEGRPIDFSKIRIPCFFLGGWYDETSKNGPLENWNAIASTPGGEELLKKCRLVMGPWNHGEVLPIRVGERQFGNGASHPFGVSPSELLIRWFDSTLKGKELPDEAPVSLFVMGRNEWRRENAWPVAGVEKNVYYLSSNGKAGCVENDGRLETNIPKGEKEDVFVYNPEHPVPFRVPGISSECQNYENLEKRADILTYTSDVLEEDLEVTGLVEADIYVSSSCPDTDFMLKLTEVYPDGRSINITDGAVRASYNNTYVRQLLRPDEIRKLHVVLGNTSNLFRKGNRIRLDVTSSCFPKYDRNHNTADRIGSSADMQVATNHVHHTVQYPSMLILPVVPSR